MENLKGRKLLSLFLSQVSQFNQHDVIGQRNTDYPQTITRVAGETEIVEFKEAKTTYDAEKLGHYFSALSNEANLSEKPFAWLIFGVRDNRNVVGSQYRLNRPHLDHLKAEIADKTTDRVTFIEIYEVNHEAGRVVMFQIPAAPKGMPIAYAGHYYGRASEDLGPLNLEEIERIRAKSSREDWSAAVVRQASMNDLDPAAIAKARIEFKKKNPRTALEADSWSIATFLNKAKLAINGQLTRTALLLLGKPESAHYLNPSVAQVTWLLKKPDGTALDYEHFGPPFLLGTNRILAKIRNLRYRYLPDGTLFPDEVDMYDAYVIREALHNCLAHQDYTLCERVNVVEYPEHLIFENAGRFLPGSVEEVIERDAPPTYYRNRFLADAMVNLDMIDTIGSGIRRMFDKQRERFFPMPDYDLSKQTTVRVQLEGKIVDVNYSQLVRSGRLDLMTVILLDKVQKNKANLLTVDQLKRLRQEGLIDGRKPFYHVSMVVAQHTGQQTEYIQNWAFDDEHFKNMIIEYLRRFESATRSDIDKLLLSKLANVMDVSQKQTKISNFLTALRTNGVIVNVGNDRKSKWVLVQKESKRT